ncbi:MAG TPA: hypothetical protein VD908_16055 [Cytophagales bacterium]|nr:hypothetical protein [Cytophagales bacterium]
METTDKTLLITESPLKTYIQFLLENNMEVLKEDDKDIIEEIERFFFENLGAESQNRKITNITTINDFLNNVIEDNTINDVKQNLISLIQIKLLEVYNMEVLLSGIRLLYRLRKESIFEHLAQYCDSVQDAVSVSLELDILFSEIEEYTFQVLTKYSRERISILKSQLYETQEFVEKLDVAHKELMEKFGKPS